MGHLCNTSATRLHNGHTHTFNIYFFSFKSENEIGKHTKKSSFHALFALQSHTHTDTDRPMTTYLICNRASMKKNRLGCDQRRETNKKKESECDSVKTLKIMTRKRFVRMWPHHVCVCIRIRNAVVAVANTIQSRSLFVPHQSTEK